MEYQTRNEVEEKYKLDMSLYVKDDNDLESKINEVNKLLKEIKNKREVYLTSGKNFYDTLTIVFDAERILDDLVVYTSVSCDFDLSDGDNSLKYERISNLWKDYDLATTYIITDLMNIEMDKINDFIKEYPRLNDYKFWIDNILRNKEHILNENDEKLISLLSKNYRAYSQIADKMTDSALDYGNVIVDGKKTEITSGNYRNLLMNENRDVRKKVYTLFNKKLKQFRDIYATSLNAYLSYCNDIAKIRKYKSVLDMDSFESNIPEAVHETVTKVTFNRLDTYQKYFKLIKKRLNLNKLHTYDLYVPLANSQKNYSIKEAKEIILKSLSVLGEDYVEKLKLMFNERRIDFATYKNKKSGAYSTATYNSKALVFTNYKNKLEDISILAHELGHAVHSIYSIENNNFSNYQYDLFVAEVASLTNEIILSSYIMKNSDDKNEKMASIYNILNVFQNNFYDAILEGRLEDIAHEKIQNGESVNADILDDIIKNLRSEFYGSTVELDDLYNGRWARREHYYFPFYLYKYATCVSAAMYFAKNIINGNKEVLNKYKEFLKSGGNDYPYNQMLKSGVDFADDLVYNEAIDYFDELIEEFNKLIEVK